MSDAKSKLSSAFSSMRGSLSRLKPTKLAASSAPAAVPTPTQVQEGGVKTTVTTEETNDGEKITRIVTTTTFNANGSTTVKKQTTIIPLQKTEVVVEPVKVAQAVPPVQPIPTESPAADTVVPSHHAPEITITPSESGSQAPSVPVKRQPSVSSLSRKFAAPFKASAETITRISTRIRPAPTPLPVPTHRDSPPRHHVTSSVSRESHHDALDYIIHNRAVRDASYSGTRLYITDLETEFVDLDVHAKNAPTTLKTLDDIAAYLLRGPGEMNDIRKLRLVYAFIATHIQYDTQLQVTKVFKKDKETMRDLLDERATAEKVLSRGRAVCDGYADLFCDLSKRVGITNVWKVVGGAKGAKSSPGDAFVDVANHAWNVVLVLGEYRFVDCTFGAGCVESNKFTFHFEPGYFLARPKHFIFTHFPVDPEFQYLEYPLSVDEFIQLPKIHAGYLQSTAKLLHPRGLEGGTALLSYIEVNDTAFTVEIELPDSLILAPGTSWRPNATFNFPASKKSPPNPFNPGKPLVWSEKVNRAAIFDQVTKNGPKVEVVTSLKRSDDAHHVLKVTGYCPSGGDGILSISLFDLEKSKALRTYRPDGSYSISFDPQTIALKHRGQANTLIRHLIDFRIRNCGTGKAYKELVKQLDTGDILPVNSESMEIVSPMEAQLEAGKEYDFVVDVTYKEGLGPCDEGPVLGLLLGGAPVDLAIHPESEIRIVGGKRIASFEARKVRVEKGRVMIGLVTRVKKLGGISFSIKGVAQYVVK